MENPELAYKAVRADPFLRDFCEDLRIRHGHGAAVRHNASISSLSVCDLQPQA